MSYFYFFFELDSDSAGGKQKKMKVEENLSPHTNVDIILSLFYLQKKWAPPENRTRNLYHPKVESYH